MPARKAISIAKIAADRKATVAARKAIIKQTDLLGKLQEVAQNNALTTPNAWTRANPSMSATKQLALEQAVRVVGHKGNAIEVIAAARLFETYLTGK